MKERIALTIALMTVGACSPGPDDTEPYDAVATSRDTAGHANHDMADRSRSGQPQDHAGMDMSRPGPAQAESMDHSRMSPMPSPPSQDTRSIARHPASPDIGHAGPGTPSHPQGMPGDGHSAMPAMETIAGAPAVQGDDPATDKLRQLIALLVEDTAVQRRIEIDPVLRALWQDDAVRAILTAHR